MTRGILLFAHNSSAVDYGLLSIVSGGLAKKNLNVPVSLVTDESTVQWLKQSNMYSTASDIFDKIIIVDQPSTTNTRQLRDGTTKETIPFINANRQSAWELTPYDRTLLIDVDYLILSTNLSQFWEVDFDIMISPAINDICSDNRIGYHDKYISDTGVHLYWATTVMFTKNHQSRIFFDLVESIKNNYKVYSDIYRFSADQYRNDISFSVAKHILDGFSTNLIGSLPPILTAQDRDVLVGITDSKLTFLIDDIASQKNFPTVVSGIDIHVMNKQSIVRHADKLMGII